MPITFLGSPENSASRDELIEEALYLLLAPDRAELPSGPETSATRQAIEKICGDYITNLKEAEASPGISEARNALKKLAPATASLADQFRQHANKSVFGVATFNPTDSTEITQAKRDEIDSLKTYMLNAATDLDKIATRLFARLDRWEGKSTGELRSHGMALANPGKQLAIATARLFIQHRSLRDFDASHDGEFCRLDGLLFEIAIRTKPKKSERLRDVRDAVKAIRSQQ